MDRVPDGPGLRRNTDAQARHARDAVRMGSNRDSARRRDEEDRELFAVRRIERSMAAAVAALERRLVSFEDDIHAAEQAILAEWVAEHQGLAPERPPSWQST